MNWEGLERHRMDLLLPLIVIRGRRGVVACGPLTVDTFDRSGEVGVVTTPVDSFDDALSARVVGVSRAAAAAGISVGMTGADAIERIR